MNSRKRLALVSAAFLGVIGIFVIVSQVAFTAKPAEVPKNESRSFPGRAEAEAAVGYQLREPNWLPSNWHLKDAVLSESYYPSARSEGQKSVMIRFEGGGTGTQLLLVQTKTASLPGEAGGTDEPFQVQGVSGTLSHGDSEKKPNLLVLSWNKEGTHFELVALLGDGLSFDDFKRIAESIS